MMRGVTPRMTRSDPRCRALAHRHHLTVAMTAVYVGFILLIAYAKPFLGRILVPGLSVGLLLGALVIVVALGLIVIYVTWANRHYDAAVAALKRGAAPR